MFKAFMSFYEENCVRFNLSVYMMIMDCKRSPQTLIKKQHVNLPKILNSLIFMDLEF